VEFEYRGESFNVFSNYGFGDYEIDIYKDGKYYSSVYIEDYHMHELATLTEKWQIKEWVINQAIDNVDDIYKSEITENSFYNEMLANSFDIFLGLSK